MPNVTAEADYDRYESGEVIGLSQNTTGTLPSEGTTVKKAEKIIVQAHPDNVGWVRVYQVGFSGGYYLSPGQMQVLSGREPSDWRIKGSGEGGQSLVWTYLSGAS